jgi:hypothetical protein
MFCTGGAAGGVSVDSAKVAEELWPAGTRRWAVENENQVSNARSNLPPLADTAAVE